VGLRAAKREVVSVHLSEIDWPEFGVSEERPAVGRAQLEARLEAARGGTGGAGPRPARVLSAGSSCGRSCCRWGTHRGCSAPALGAWSRTSEPSARGQREKSQALPSCVLRATEVFEARLQVGIGAQDFSAAVRAHEDDRGLPGDLPKQPGRRLPVARAGAQLVGVDGVTLSQKIVVHGKQHAAPVGAQRGRQRRRLEPRALEAGADRWALRVDPASRGAEVRAGDAGRLRKRRLTGPGLEAENHTAGTARAASPVAFRFSLPSHVFSSPSPAVLRAARSLFLRGLGRVGFTTRAGKRDGSGG
jgi:hypothetical protein